MGKIEAIEKAIAQLSPHELNKLRAWMDEPAAQAFDNAIECDANAGKLDWLVAEGRAEMDAGEGQEI